MFWGVIVLGSGRVVDGVWVADVRDVVCLSIRWFRGGVVRSYCGVCVFGRASCLVLFAWSGVGCMGVGWYPWQLHSIMLI